ncbi:MAG: CCA tRNA nucleotidyltransferase [Candidatus Pacebacteria bacterium]|nr:CCA tRNA nucleotidyltransferase [Candidatus Paceibacterota bacterium]MBP9867002.1 CCA tRNA nucleotidyltransferase [Candidatus Paceibacterota bacterium]
MKQIQELQGITIPKEVLMVLAVLQGASFEAFLVGGCVRDLIMGVKPKDFDITTNATPEEIIALFPKTFYENSFGTVGVVTCGEENLPVCSDETVKIVEVTPYRLETTYSDNRHPDEVMWSKHIEDDLKRRDFTCNAIAYNPITGEVIDPFDGVSAIKDKILKAVGDADLRFKEDGLRLMRAVRFMSQLDFDIDTVTRESVERNSDLLINISRERIKDEFCKLLITDYPMRGIIFMKELSILRFVVPELEKGIGVMQNQAHSFDVWEHNLRTLQHSADKKWPLHVRLSALFHDIAKPETRRFSKEKGDYTFYGHDVVGGRVTREIMERLKFPKDLTDKVSMFVRWHMFFSDTEQITISAVRRLITNVGKDNIWDLVNLRICDRIGTGRPKEEPYRLRMYESMIEEALQDPISLKMLKTDGKRIMDVTQETAGPKIGYVLHALFDEVLENPEKNTEVYLDERAAFLMKLSVDDLSKLGRAGKDEMEEKNKEKVQQIRKQFKVKQ